MQAETPSFRRLLRRAAVLSLCVCFVGGGTVRAQKNPPIFKTESGNSGGSTSATNMVYVNSLESEYKAAEVNDKEAAKLLRNKLIYIGVEQIDTYFNDYRRKSRKRNELVQFILDFLEIGASTALAITNGDRAREVIAESLNGFKGGRSSLNKNFRLLETQILFNKMVANRADRLGEIYKKLNESVVSYPWERARSDLKNYLYAGTVDDALNSLSIETGNEAEDEERQLADIKARARVRGIPTAAEIAASTTNAAALDEILEAYEEADETVEASDAGSKQADAQIAAADKTIAEADKKIADADAKITAAKAKTPPDEAGATQAAAEKTQATADRDAAVAARAKAVAAKAKAATDKAAAEKTKEASVARLKGIYQGIRDDEVLAPLIDRVPDEYGSASPAFRAELEESIARLRANDATIEDYALILPKVAQLATRNVSSEPSVNERMQNILKANP